MVGEEGVWSVLVVSMGGGAGGEWVWGWVVGMGLGGIEVWGGLVMVGVWLGSTEWWGGWCAWSGS